jgi:hypothetical protein
MKIKIPILTDIGFGILVYSLDSFRKNREISVYLFVRFSGGVVVILSPHHSIIYNTWNRGYVLG